MKKTLLLVLAVCMIAVMVPAASFAQSQDEQGVPEEAVQMELEDEVPDGWQKDPTTGKWMYYEGGNPKIGKQFIGVGSTGHWYFFDAQGLMQVGFQTVDPEKAQSISLTRQPETRARPHTARCRQDGWITTTPSTI